MEYYQMTINDWIAMKQKLQAELLGVRRSFVRIGYILRKIDEAKGYENDGYKSIAEWAKSEYGLEGSTVSRFMAINREYSIGGFSEELLPEYEDFKRSQLEEMLKLPAEDRNMITPDTPRADIRELKAFNKQKVEGVADDIEEFLEKFIEDNWELAVEMEGVSGDPERTREAMIPSGNKSYRKGLFFLMANENKVSIKKYGGQPEEYTWQQFTQILSDIFEERNRREDEERKRREEEERNKPVEKEDIHEDQHIDVDENQMVEISDDQQHKEDQNGTGADNRSAETVAEIAGEEGKEDDGYCETVGYAESGENGNKETDEAAGAAGNSEEETAGNAGTDCEVGSGTGETEKIHTESDKPDEPPAEERTEEKEKEVIAPAQKFQERQEKNESETNCHRLESNEVATDCSQLEETVTDCHGLELEKPVEKTMTRYEYMQDLTEAGMASYLFHNVLKTARTVKDMKNWLHQIVDEKGRKYE